MATILPTNVIQTTAEQEQLFRAWATSKYSSYKEYSEPTEEIAIFIRTHIFTMEMKRIWRETEPYVGVRYYGDIHINRLMRYRDILVKKIKYMKEKLGKLAFPLEAAAMRAATRAAVERRRLRLRSQYESRIFLVISAEAPADVMIPQIPKKMVPLLEADETVVDDCVICMDTHLIVDTCLTNCGHRFGSKCFDKLVKWNCPLCRTVCTEVTEYIRIGVEEVVE